MKGKKKRIVIYLLSGVIITMALIAAFIYFSVDNRVKIETAVPVFSNNQIVERLDSIALQPDSISQFITSLMEKGGVTGIGISIINRNAVVYQQYFGMADSRKKEPLKPGMIWYGASLSKPIFADIVLQLVEEHVLDLDTPLYRYLPKPLFSYKTNRIQQLFGANYIDYTSLQDDARFKKITARMCLSHTSGLPNWRWIESDGRLKIKFEPGSRYSYSGEGMFLLQFVIEQITGRNFEDIALEKVFKPLGMTRSSYVWQREYEANYARGHDKNGNALGIPKTNVPNAAGSLSTTLEDVTRYFVEVLSQKQERYRRLITPQIAIRSKQQFGPNSGIDTNENDPIHLAYGLGVGLYEAPYGRAFFKEGHGEGWQHYAVGFPLKGAALIILSNSDNAEGTFKALIEFCLGNRYTPWYWEGYIPI